MFANPHPTTPYEVLKDRLLNNHSLVQVSAARRQKASGSQSGVRATGERGLCSVPPLHGPALCTW
jgi:hypothetical protein